MKPFYTLVFSLILSGLALAQPAGPSLQVQSRRGSSVNLGIGADGSPGFSANGQRGSMQISLPSGGAGLQARDWNNASLSRGPQGELVLSDPNQGTITMGRGLHGTTHIQTRQGSFTLDNSMVQQFLHGQGQNIIDEQLQGR